MKFVDKYILDLEEKEPQKLYALEVTNQAIPYSQLSDRSFEILMYKLLKKEKPEQLSGMRVQVELMEGVADRGRDICFVTENGKIIGIVQCKNWKNKITKPILIEEVLKTILFFYLAEETELPKYYWIACPEELNSRAKDLIQNTSKILDEDIEKYFEQLVEKYSSFESLLFCDVKNYIYNCINALSIFEYSGTHINEMLEHNIDILSSHFKIVSLIDMPIFSKLFDEKMRDYGIKTLSDDDLKILQKRIGDIPQDARLRMMGIDFYGIYPDALEFSKGNGKELFQGLLKSKTLLHKMLADNINNEMHSELQRNISFPMLLKQIIIHPYTIEFASQFMLKALLYFMQIKSTPEGVLDDIKSKETIFIEIESEVKESILQDLNNMYNGDFSNFTGLMRDNKIFQKQLCDTMFFDISKVEDIGNILNNEIKEFWEIIMDIVDRLIIKYTLNKTIIIHDLNILDSDDYVKQIKISLENMNKWASNRQST
jgi:hypothetical protein